MTIRLHGCHPSVIERDESARDGGRWIGPARAFDALIAATAIARGIPLYTCNPSDFDGIEPKLELKDASEMGRLADALKAGGFHEEEVEKIFWQNGEQYLKDILG